MPGYIFDRKPCWIEPIGFVDAPIVQKTEVSAIYPIENTVTTSITNNHNTEIKASRKESISIKISEIIKNASGISYEPDAASNTFLELGLDSLSLTQLSGKLKKSSICLLLSDN